SLADSCWGTVKWTCIFAAALLAIAPECSGTGPLFGAAGVAGGGGSGWESATVFASSGDGITRVASQVGHWISEPAAEAST
ncbi:MAG TPA: hypothetical protein DCY13_21455, partial [Verrucomicrobiales bacterium]|nr:hypothetical protein [Verrucomicrobiales bacterium]